LENLYRDAAGHVIINTEVSELSNYWKST